MLLDLTPTACPICAAPKSHDAPQVGTLRGRIFQCGAIVCLLDAGEWEVTLYCAKTADELDALRAEVARLNKLNVGLGDRNVLMAMELDAIATLCENALGVFVAYEPTEVAEQAGPFARALRDVYDLAVEALAGSQPIAVPASGEPGQGGPDVEQGSAVSAATARGS